MKELIIKALSNLLLLIVVVTFLMLIAKLTNLLVMVILSPFIGLVYGFIAVVFVRWKKSKSI